MELFEIIGETCDPHPPGRHFSNWLNSCGKSDFLWGLKELNCDKPQVVRYLMLAAFNAGRASTTPPEGPDRFLLCSPCGDYTRHCKIDQGPPWDSLNGYICQVCDEFIDEEDADAKEFYQ